MNKTNAISRRTLMHGLPIALAASVIPVAAAAAATSIPELYRQWRICREWTGSDDAEGNANYLQYCSLQSQIVAAEPRNARDVAIQFLVDSDGYESENSPGFVDAMRKLAEV